MLKVFKFWGMYMYADSFTYEVMTEHVMIDDVGELDETSEVSFETVREVKRRRFPLFNPEEKERYVVLYTLFDRNVADCFLTAEEVRRNMEKYRGRDARLFRASSLKRF